MKIFKVLLFCIVFSSTFACAEASIASSHASFAINNLQACVASSKSMNVLFLVDTSGSLHNSDPSAARVTAIKAELAGLKNTANVQDLLVNVSMVGFSTAAEIVQPWTSLSDSNLNALDQAANSFGNKNNGLTTNFPSALKLAWSQIISATKTEPNSCSVLLWFTDGKIDLGPNISHASAVQAMCSPDGYPNQLAANGVFTFAIGLGGPMGMSSTDKAELLSYVEGGGNGTTNGCGTSISPSTGKFFPVDNAALLMFALQSALDPSVPSSPNQTTSCTSSVNCSPVASPWLGRGVSSARIFATTSNGVPISVVVTSPTGSIKLDPSLTSGSLSGAEISYQNLSSESMAASIDVRDPVKATGTWTIQFISQSSAKVYYWVGLTPSVQFAFNAKKSFVRGAGSSPGSVSLVDISTGKRVTGLSVKSLSATVSGLGDTLSPAQNLNLTQTGDRWSYSFLNTFPDNNVSISLTGNLLVGPNHESIPLQQTIVLPAQLPAEYPTIQYLGSSPSSFQIGSPETLKFQVKTIGATSGCLGSVAARAQGGHPAITLKTNVGMRHGCTVVSKNSPVLVEIKVSTNVSASAIIPVLVKFQLKGRPLSQWKDSILAVKVVLTKPLNVAKSLVNLLLIMLLGFTALITALKLLNRKYAYLLPRPRELVVKTYSVAIASNSEGILFLEEDRTGKARLTPPSIIDDGFVPKGEGLRPQAAIQIPASESAYYELAVRPMGPFGILTLFLGTLNTRIRRIDEEFPLFLAGNLSGQITKPLSAPMSAVELSSTVVSNTWLFCPMGSVDSPDFVKDGSGVILTGGPYILGELTVLLSDTATFEELIHLAATSLRSFFDESSEIFLADDFSLG